MPGIVPRTVSLILLVEDCEEDEFLFRVALGKIAPEVTLHWASGGEQAVIWLESRGNSTPPDTHRLPDIVITDLKMPGMNGFEFIEVLGRRAEHRRIPTIVLSSSFLDADVIRAFDLGANGFFAKPSRTAELQELIRAMLAFWNLSWRP